MPSLRLSRHIWTRLLVADVEPPHLPEPSLGAVPSPAVAAIVRLSPSSCDEKAGREKVVCSSIVFAAVMDCHLALVSGFDWMMRAPVSVT